MVFVSSADVPLQQTKLDLPGLYTGILSWLVSDPSHFSFQLLTSDQSNENMKQ